MNSSTKMKKTATYQSSGVDIDKANRFIRAAMKDIRGTFNSSVLRRPGAFGGLFAIDPKKYKSPVLVSSTDGVGTKLLVAKTIGRHDTIGIDLVAMNVNDILCVGAKPLFFLDYIACGRLNPRVLQKVMKGITRGCRLAGCALVGGETAEMPGMYKEDDYDLAGFAVGIVEKDKIIDGSKIAAGDCVIGIPSSGLHSNGFSLVRKVFSAAEQKKLANELLRPTRIYTDEVLSVTQRFRIKGIAHNTGGAFYDKLTRILPPGRCFVIQKGSWPVPKIFQLLQTKGRIRDGEMFRTFNMGIGLAIVLDPKSLKDLQSFLNARGIEHYIIGKVISDQTRKIIL